MNKRELIEKVAEKNGTSKVEAAKAVNAVIGTMAETLKKGEKIQLVGFGTFETRKRAARKGKNPQTGEELVIPACVAPAFKPGKALKDSINY